MKEKKEQEKKVFIYCESKDTCFLTRVAVKQIGLKIASKKEDADYLIVELKRPFYNFHENNLEEIDERPAIILTTQSYNYQQQISNNLRARKIENKKLIVQIPALFDSVVKEFKKILNEE